MPCHHMQHAQNMGPNVFACNENSAYVMPCVTTCGMTSCAHAQHMHAGTPAALCKCGTPEITYGHAIHDCQTISIKINHHIF